MSNVGREITTPTRKRIKRLIPSITPVYGRWVSYKVIHFVSANHVHLWVNLQDLEWGLLGDNAFHFPQCKELFK